MSRKYPASPDIGEVALGTLLLVVMIACQQSVYAQNISENEFAGKKLFLQRCSVCHMPAPSQQLSPDLPTYGPKLEGFINNAESENRTRLAIVNGTPRMPGFKYGLTENEIDQIVTYLKIFKLSDFIRPDEEVGGGPDVIIPVTDRTRTIEDPED